MSATRDFTAKPLPNGQLPIPLGSLLCPLPFLAFDNRATSMTPCFKSVGHNQTVPSVRTVVFPPPMMPTSFMNISPPLTGVSEANHSIIPPSRLPISPPLSVVSMADRMVIRPPSCTSPCSSTADTDSSAEELIHEALSIMQHECYRRRFDAADSLHGALFGAVDRTPLDTLIMTGRY